MAAKFTLRALCFAVGYLFGSILTAEIVAHCVAGKSARQIGSGNPGMANIAIYLGKRAGLAVLGGDTAKTLLACAAAWLLAGSTIGRASLLYAGLGAIVGHNFPLWAGGRGGKGVAVTCVWLMVYLWPWGVAACALGGAAMLLTGYLPLGAVIIPIAAIPAALALYGAEGGLGTAATALMMLARHKHGLQRIAAGKERKYFRKSK